MSNTSDYLILFGDLVASTEVAVEASPSFFAQTYVASFHWAASKAFEFVKNKRVFPKAKFSRIIAPIRIAGDEVLTFTPLDQPGVRRTQAGLQDLIASAVSFAYATKLYWLAAPYNLQRIHDKQFPRDISFGIHIGPVAAVQPTRESDIAGLHINIAKRIQSKATDGTESRIFASRDVTDLFEAWRQRKQSLGNYGPPLRFTRFVERAEPIEGKGVPKKLKVLELEQAERDTGFMLGLLDQLEKTPETEDVDAERAARIFAETFLPSSTYPFRTKKGIAVASDFKGGAPAYISAWFEAIKGQTKLFLDEPWLVLNSYFVSCAMLRHPAIKNQKTKLELYKKIASNLHALLVQLLANHRK